MPNTDENYFPYDRTGLLKLFSFPEHFESYNSSCGAPNN